MRHWAIGLMILGVGMMGLLVGCESDSAPEESADYDPDLDGPPTNLVVRPDREILEDQALIAARDKKAAELAAGPKPGGPGGPGAAAEDPKVKEAREVMDKVIEAGKSGRFSAILDYLEAGDRDAMKDTMAALSELTTAAGAMQKAVKENLKMNEVPASLQQALGKGPGGGPALASVGDLATDMLNYELDGNSVTVTGGNAPMKLTKRADGWRIELSAADKAAFAAMAELMQAQMKFVKTLADGINDRTVTENNIDQKVMGLMEELLEPVRKKMLEGAPEKDANSGGAP